MIVLLPPSETKRVGGDGPPLRLETLSAPELGPLRTALVDELVELAGDRAECRRPLGLSTSQDGEIHRNGELRSAPTLPAIARYTGVLYDALESSAAVQPSRSSYPPKDRREVLARFRALRPSTTKCEAIAKFWADFRSTFTLVRGAAHGSTAAPSSPEPSRSWCPPSVLRH